MRTLSMKTIVLLALVLGLVACAAPDAVPPAATAAPMLKVDGQVIQLSRNALPPGTMIHVRLLDVSRADAPSVTLDEQQIRLDGTQLPKPFALKVAADRIDPRMSYAVAADARLNGALLMISTTHHGVLTRGAPSSGVEVVLMPAARP
ncbi:MAG: hypothetical protein RLZZ598_1810 [Pseudomonadota bacterium]|jgi:putative lipoprotein